MNHPLLPSTATPSPAHRTARAPAPLSLRARVLAGLVITSAGLLAGLLAGAGRGLLGEAAVMVLSLVLGAGLAGLAAARFWAMLLTVFVLRASLDALKLADHPAGSCRRDPAVVVGLVFIAAAATWLFARRSNGTLHPPSTPTRWMIALAATGSAGALLAGSFSSISVSLKIWAGALMLATLEQVFLDRPERIRPLLAAGAASMLVPAIAAAVQLATPRPLDEFLTVSRIQGTFVHPNPFATYLVILGVMALAVRPHLDPRRRLVADAVLAVTVTLTLFTYARGAWMALLAGVLVIGLCQDRRLIALLVAAVAAATAFIPSVTSRLSDLWNTQGIGDGDANSLAWRVGYWRRLLPLSTENPVTGIGLDQVLVRSPEQLMPHNSYVQALVETGALGVVMLFGLLVSSAIALRAAIRATPVGLERGVAVGAAAVATGWALQMLTENLLTQAAIYWYLAAPIAFALTRRPRPGAVATTVAGVGSAPEATPTSPP